MGEFNTVTVDLSATAHVPPGDPIREAAERLRIHAGAFASSLEDLRADWQEIPDLYRGTDHDAPLYAAFDDPYVGADDVKAMTGALVSALGVLADEFDRIRDRRAQIEGPERDERQAWFDAQLVYAEPYAASSLLNVAGAPLREAGEQLAEDLRTAEEAFSTAVGNAESLWTLGAPVTRLTRDAVSSAEAAAEALEDGEATAEEVASFYERLSALTPDQIRQLAATHPELRTMTPPLPGSPEELAAWPTGADGAAWWNALSFEQQKALVEEMPGTVTNTEGVAYTDRSAAGLRLLSLLEGDPSLTDRQREDLKGVRDSLTPDIRGLLPEERPSIVSLRMDGDGTVLAAVAFGDLDTADNVAFNVPGMGTEVRDMPNLLDQSFSTFRNMESNRALIAWVGYDTPNQAMDPETLGAASVLSNDQAKTGAIALAAATDGFVESRQNNDEYLEEVLHIDPAQVDDDPRLTMLAHSYGTPTLALALALTRHAVSAAVLYGTVGVPADRVPHVSTMHVDRDAAGEPEVYATVAKGDWVASLAGNWAMPLRENPPRVVPTEKEFGAKAFSSDGDESGAATTMHGMIEGLDNRLEENRADLGYGYLEEGSQAQQNIMKIVNGRGEQVTQVDQSSWDDLRDRLEAVDPNHYGPAVDASQSARRAQAETEQTEQQRLVDAFQKEHLADMGLGNMLIDGAQQVDTTILETRLRAEEAVVDGAQDLIRAPKDVVEARLPALNEMLEKVDEGVDFTDVVPEAIREQ